MTHMAPEILLEGRVSKAVDVSEGGGGGRENGRPGEAWGGLGQGERDLLQVGTLALTREVRRGTRSASAYTFPPHAYALNP